MRNTEERNTRPMHGRSESPLAAARASAENVLSNLKEKAESAAKEFSELASLSCISLRKDIPPVLFSSPNLTGLPSVDKTGWQLPSLPWMGTRKPAAKSGAGSADLSDGMQALALHALHTLHTLHTLASLEVVAGPTVGRALAQLQFLRVELIERKPLRERCGNNSTATQVKR